jgi:predicted nucleic acid-binding protein
MASLVVVLDANVLYGIEVTDLILTAATLRCFRVHWSPEILDEVRRNLATRIDLDLLAVDRRIAQMNTALPGALTDIPDGLADSMPVNQKDRHVLALAVHIAAPIIVTGNLRDFPIDLCGQHGVEALSSDQFLASYLRADQDNSEDLLRAIEAMAARRRRPPKTIADILNRLEPELPVTVSLLRIRFD